MPEMHEVRRADGYFETIDANFDGAQDIKLAAAWGAGPNGLDHFWLFDPESRRFIYDKQLSGISNVEVDPATMTIKSSARDNAVHDVEQTYRYLDGKLTLVEQIDDTHSDERGGYSRVTKKLRNGKLRVVKKEFIAEPK